MSEWSMGANISVRPSVWVGKAHIDFLFIKVYAYLRQRCFGGTAVRVINKGVTH